MQFLMIHTENPYSMIKNFIMLINCANQLSKLMSTLQIDKMSDQNEDLKRHISC